MEIKEIKNGLWEKPININFEELLKIQFQPTRDFRLYTGPRGAELFNQAFEQGVERYVIGVDPVSPTATETIITTTGGEVATVDANPYPALESMTEEQIIEYLDKLENE